jgi:hypothetical protein
MSNDQYIPGKPGLFRRTPTGPIWISYYRNGKRFRESSRHTDVTKANRVLLRRKGEIESGNFVEPTARRIKVDDLISDLLLWYRNEKHKARYADHSEGKWRQHLEPFFGGMKAEQVTTDTLRAYRSTRATDDPKPSPSTVNRELAILRKAFKLAAQASPPTDRACVPGG